MQSSSQPVDAFGIPIPQAEVTTDLSQAGPGGIYLTLPTAVNEHKYLAHGSQEGVVVDNRTWSAALVYDSGAAYLAGFLGGSAIGTVRGLASSGGLPTKLKINAVLNNAGRLGSNTAATFGVFAMMFSFAKTIAKDQRKKNDVYNDVIAAGAAGVITSLPKGNPVTIAAMGTVCASAAMLYATINTNLEEMAKNKSK